MKVALVAFLDIIISMLIVVLVMVNPKVENQDDVLQPPGNLLVYTTWPMKAGDVDTWMLAPEMSIPIGYSNKESSVCNLVKDDLGRDMDPLGINYENIFCRSTPDGDYVINLHAYGLSSLPVEVNVQVALNVDGMTVVLFNEKVSLGKFGEEVTVIRWKMKDNHVIPDSVHHTQIILRG